jgi:7-cyano-7-deazaguanine reductase
MNESKYLGKSVQYPQQYAPEMLVPVPRHLNREQYGLYNNQLPFTGYDVWHAYEFSFLTQKGLPVTGILKMVYPSDSPFLVESKSLKLYLNSLNMERYGATPREGIKEVISIIQKDISKVLQTEVTLHFFDAKESQYFDFWGYELLEKTGGIETVTFSEYREAPHLLCSEQSSSEKNILKVATHLLRSNCKVTFQPDWGSAFIYLKGKDIPDKIGLLKYLVSIRNENHFHEEICEMIYKRLWDRFTPEQLMVACLYTRRGGIDICPVRASQPHLLPQYLINPYKLTDKLLRQ